MGEERSKCGLLSLLVLAGYISYLNLSSSLKWEQIVLKIVFILSGLKCGELLKKWEYQTTWPASSEICMQVKNQQLEPDMEQQTASELGMEYVKAVYCHPAYLTYMQSTSCEMPGWMKHKLGSRLPGEISITSDMQMSPPLWQRAKRNWKASWWKWKRRMKNMT